MLGEAVLHLVEQLRCQRLHEAGVLHDHVRAVLFLLDHPEITGPVNLTGPAPATQFEVVKALASQARRPSFVPAPTLALRLVLGEMAGEVRRRHVRRRCRPTADHR